MCRIAGIITHTGSHLSRSLVAAMCDVQEHGGPDDSGLYQSEDSRVTLGHRRLSLIDVSSCGHQPMSHKNNLFITYNGEIYNYKTLKTELQACGQQFHTGSDTEVILAAYRQWGTASFTRLEGMFAFALWDKVSGEVLLVRDAAGIKPIYFHHDAHCLRFASEIRALSLLPGIGNDPAWAIQLLAYGHIPEPGTTLKNVKALPKGCFIKYKIANNSFGLQSFKFYNYNSRLSDKKQALLQLQATMQKAVADHLIADVPVGVFLSGGIDSAIIAGLADKHSRHINYLSLYYNDNKFSEKKYQDLLLQKLKGKGHQYLLEQSSFEEGLPKAIAQMDMPSCDGINTWFISRLARQNGLKAVLSGIGADEYFGGYPSFTRLGLAQQIQNSPSLLLQAANMSRQKYWRRLAYLQLEGIKGQYLFLRGHFTPVQIAQQLGASEKEVWQVLSDTPVLPELKSLEKKNQASWMEVNLYMQNQLLRDADVMGMAHGVEIRVPFLDANLLTLVHQLDAPLKYSGTKKKGFLVQAFQGLLPPAIHERNKMGFSFPFASWLSQSKFMAGKMESANPQTKKTYAQFLKGNVHWSQMLSLLHLHLRNEN